MTTQDFFHRRSRWLFAVFAAVCASGLALFAADKDKDAKQPPPKFSTDSRPVDRDHSLRVSYSDVVKKTSPSVVYVFSTKKVRRSQYEEQLFNDPMFRRFFGVPDDDSSGGSGNGFGNRRRQPRESLQQGLGSGVIVASNGYILTNNHVVDGADEVKVQMGDSTTKDYEAKIIGRDEQADIAVLKIEADGLPAIKLGDSDQLEVGDTVLAIGNPFGVGKTVTHGIVSALRRGGLGIEQYEDFIQTDAAINPGNSGGALLDAEGRLIGINTAILSRTGASNGVGFAIPVNLARSIMEQLIANGRVDRGFLGVTTQPLDADLAKQFDVEHGAVITQVQPDSAAAKAGLKAGDVITQINDTKIEDPRTLALAVARIAPDIEIAVHYTRDGKKEEKKIKLGRRESQSLSGASSTGSGSDEGVLNGVGVADISDDYRQQLRIPEEIQGAIITQVEPDSASAKAGLREGDVILELDRQRVKDAASAVKRSEEIKGPKVLVLLWRDRVRRYVVVDESKK